MDLKEKEKKRRKVASGSDPDKGSELKRIARKRWRIKKSRRRQFPAHASKRKRRKSDMEGEERSLNQSVIRAIASPNDNNIYVYSYLARSKKEANQSWITASRTRKMTSRRKAKAAADVVDHTELKKTGKVAEKGLIRFWAVRLEDKLRPSKSFSSQQEAIAYANRLKEKLDNSRKKDTYKVELIA